MPKILNEKELESATGGTHLSLKEAKSLQKGQLLILEDGWGRNLAKVEVVEATAEGGDTALVKVLSLRNGENTFTANIFSGFNQKLTVGEIISVTINFLDFPERAG